MSQVRDRKTLDPKRVSSDEILRGTSLGRLSSDCFLDHPFFTHINLYNSNKIGKFLHLKSMMIG